MEVCFVLGTRPEIIKLAPLINRFRDGGVKTDVIHTGQHYSYTLDESFFEDLDLNEPDYRLNVGSKSQGAQTGEIVTECERIFERNNYDLVIIQGDTNSTLGGALAAVKIPNCDIAHVEAGLRSFDNEMPEEINRRLTDVCSDFYFVPTEDAAENIRNESQIGNVNIVGNTVVDSIIRHRELAEEQSTILSDLDLSSKKYILFTAHRQENVDDSEIFEHIVSELEKIAEKRDIVYPIHPRAKKRAKEFNLFDRVNKTVDLLEPQPYLNFLTLENHAEVILTDSGGVQEEAIVLGTPCITIRDTTERPETVQNGGNVLVDPSNGKIHKTLREVLDPKRYEKMSNAENPFGDGETSERIFQICQEWYE